MSTLKQIQEQYGNGVWLVIESYIESYSYQYGVYFESKDLMHWEDINGYFEYTNDVSTVSAGREYKVIDMEDKEDVPLGAHSEEGSCKECELEDSEYGYCKECDLFDDEHFLTCTAAVQECSRETCPDIFKGHSVGCVHYLKPR
jgi:hypothetical protein